MSITAETLQQLLSDHGNKQKKEREEENKTNLDKLKVFISSAVKQEVETKLLPVTEKQEVLDKEQKELKLSHDNLATQVQQLDSLVKNYTSHPLVMEPLVGDRSQTSTSDKINMIVQDSRRRLIIPVTSIDCEHANNLVPTNGCKYLKAAEEYFKTTMKVPLESLPSIVASSPILGPNTDESNFRNVCVEFGSVASCQEVSRFAKNLPRDQRIMLHVSPVLRERFRALSKLAYELRHEEQPYKTCIKYDSQGLILLALNPMEFRWNEVDTSHLPGPDMGLLATTPPTKAQNKRARPSPTSSEKSPEVARTEAPRWNTTTSHPLSTPSVLRPLPIEHQQSQPLNQQLHQLPLEQQQHQLQNQQLSESGLLAAATGVQDVGIFSDIQASTPSTKQRVLVQQKLNFGGTSTAESVLDSFGHPIDDSINQGN